MEENLILAINPGSTSTKIALYNGQECIKVENLIHSKESLMGFEDIYHQKDFRSEVILNWLKEQDFHMGRLRAIVGRGGLLRPMAGGTYVVTEAMLEDLKIGYQGQHASNLGGIIANDIGRNLNIPAYIVDPVAVDEFLEEARLSGLPEVRRKSLVHALNIKATARKICDKNNIDFTEASLIVAHLGGGISIAPVYKGRILDVNNANEGGPLSPERAGEVPAGALVRLCFSGKYTQGEIKKKLTREGGLLGYLGTNDAREVVARIEKGDKEAELIFKAMAYQISKEIAAMATVLKGKVDRIIITGGLAYGKLLMSWIEERVSFIAEVEVVPGENEMESLAMGALRVLTGEEAAKIYEDEVL
ncbi:MAG: butyrate kinase [Clostridiaceae bacterium]